MKVLEQEGINPEEAIEVALKKLGIPREKAKIEILEEGDKGLFGLVGTKLAKVKVTVEEDPVAEIGCQVTAHILKLMDIQAEIKAVEEEGTVCLEIKVENAGVLIGKRGQTLNALEYIVNLIVSRRVKSPKRITLDTEGYRARRKESLISLAQRVAAEVAKSKKEVVLEPMSPHERYLIHSSLQDNPQVETRSIGEGREKEIVISPKKEG